jgi:predicted outer membrane repeat protein
MLRALWNQMSRKLTRRPAPAAPARRQLRCRPTLLTLEDRVVPSTFTVTSLADSGTGSLRGAIAAAAAGDTINFAASLTGKSINLSGGQLELSKNLTIQGPSSGTVTINANNHSRIFFVDSGVTASISGLTLTHGNARKTSTDSGFGGAIEDDGTLTLSNVSFLYNTAASGGGAIDAFGSATDTLSIDSAVFTGNKAVSGFAGGISTTDQLTVTNSTFTDNSGPSGGGAIDFFVSSGAGAGTFSLTVTSDTFTGNSGANGGAIYANDSPSGGTLTISVSKSTFTDNVATGVVTGTGTSGFGGAIDSFLRPSNDATSSVSIADSTLSGNQGNFGAGIDSTIQASGSGTSSYSLARVTSTGNVGTQGGGFYDEIANTGTGSVSVKVDSSTFDNNATSSISTGGATPREVSGDGAGAFNTLSGSGTITLAYTNDTIANNSAEVSGTDSAETADGGGLAVELTDSSTPTVSLDSLTIAYNDAQTGGGGVFTNYSGLTVKNTIVANNTTSGTGADVDGTVNSLGTNLIGNTTGSSGWVGSDLQNMNAHLSTLGNNGGPTRTIALLADSPAVGAGTTSLTTDQAGNTRSTPNTDIGALEYAATTASQLVVVAQPSAASGSPFDVLVEVVDQYGNVVDNYSGTVHFSITGSGLTGLTVPADYTFTAGDAGVHTFSGGVTLSGSGNETIVVNDTTASTLFGSTLVVVS